MSKHLVLVVDGHRAKVLEKSGLQLKQLGSTIERSKVMQEFDMGAGKPGRMRAPGGTQDYAPHTDPEDVQHDSFMREVARRMNHGYPEMLTLILIAPPHSLGQLRKHLNEHILAKIDHEVAKDLTKLREDEILQYVQKPYF